MSPRAEGRTSRFLAYLALALMIAAWSLIHILGDRVWWTVAVLYGPRWVWGALLLGMLPFLVRHPRRGIVLFLFAAGLFVLGILDYRVGVGRASAPDIATLRVMEFNAEGDVGGADKLRRMVSFIKTENPDLIVIAECASKTVDALTQRLPEYHSRASFSICLFTRGEILSWEIRDPKDFWKRYGSGAIVRADLAFAGKRIRVGLVHLATPRRALAKYNDSTKVQSMRMATNTNLELRDLESQAARFWIMDSNELPTVIAGDFNLPAASAIYRRHWGDLENAFSTVGVGLGHTKRVTLWGVRIDHILMANGVRTVRAWIGADLGSDHLPLMADVSVIR